MREALAIIRKGAARIVRVDEDEIAEAMRIYWTATHNVAEGAGAAPLAALLKERERMAGKRVGADPAAAATSTPRRYVLCSMAARRPLSTALACIFQ